MKWEDGQIREFASRFAREHRQTWPVFVHGVREATIDSFVLMIVLGQVRSIDVEEVRSLRQRLGEVIASRYHMENAAQRAKPA